MKKVLYRLGTLAAVGLLAGWVLNARGVPCAAAGPERSPVMKTIVVSDLHCGVDDQVSELVRNRPMLVAFLESIAEKKSADEVVIAGDFLDQWFYPGDYDLPADSAEVYRRAAENNPTVVGAIKKLIASGVKVVYVPGNHDMTLTKDALDALLPGVQQARESAGMGRYRTGVRQEIVIEHGHRYEIFCAPDPLTNREWMAYGDPILPPGYFYARIGVTSLGQGFPQTAKELPVVPEPPKDDPDNYAAYLYYRTWIELIGTKFPITQPLDEKFIKVGVDGFRGDFSLSDLIPSQQPDGSISARLYKGIQSNWQEVQRLNRVAVPLTAARALAEATDTEAHLDYGKEQYFDVDPTVDVVIFGHTHIPAYRAYEIGGTKKIFANSGTWVDRNSDDPLNTATFVEILSGEKGDSVKVLKCVASGDAFLVVPAENPYIEKD